MQTLFYNILNISAKCYRNWSIQFWAILFQSWCVFETQCIMNFCRQCKVSSKLQSYKLDSAWRGQQRLSDHSWPC